MKLVFSLFACLAIPLGASAAPRPETDIKAGIANAVERYANAISCNGIKIRPEDVLTLKPSGNGPTLPKYAVLWTGDLGCYGGSGTEATRLSIATVNTGQYVVQPELSSPVTAFESPVRFVSLVVSNSADTLVLEGKEYAPNDPRSNPSIPVQFTLRVDAHGGWKLVGKVTRAAESLEIIRS
jgi:hypothetical protein